MKTRVIFVDDEPGVLTGIRRMLRRQRSEWEMVFAESGNEALERMAESPFDVIVTDMRMPGMDGGQLLAEVKKRYPSTVRIVLSGHADQASILRSVGLAHQYLSKPCDPDKLTATVLRACALKNTICQESLKRVISRVTTLPSPPAVYQQLLMELQSKDTSVQRVGRLISQDVGMTAKLMQLVNSSFFGIPRHIETPTHAAALLGLNTLRPLILSAGVFSQFDASGVEGYSIDVMLEHSLNVSKIANRIAITYSKDNELAEASLLAGMLHDVGQLLFASQLQTQFNEALALAHREEIPLWKAEIEVYGASHADVGAYLLSLWGLPGAVAEAVAFHHQPSKCMSDSFAPLTAVHVANSLVNEAAASMESPHSDNIDMTYLEHIGVENQLSEWQRIAENFLAVSA